MRMTKENKEWMKHAIYLGEHGTEIFVSRWGWIAEAWNNTPLNEQPIFYQKYVEFGGEDNLSYDNNKALEKACEYAYNKLNECFREISFRLNLQEGLYANNKWRLYRSNEGF